MKSTNTLPVLKTLQKSSTGIRGLDEITYGGLPKMRPTLVCGGAGCGKTLLAMEFLVRGAIQFKEKEVTVIITGERGDGALTRYGLEEYVSDCVISLDHRVVDQVTTRRIRIVKYRGSTHGTNEYPFLIEKDGISIWPITSVGLEHNAPQERIPTGIARLDTMLGGRGFYRGSSILLSGTAGTGKTSLSATFAEATCRRGERCLYILFEESPSQVTRNMATVGIDLQQWVKKGLLQFQTVRPFHFGLEMHLARTIKFVTEFAPTAVIIDPISGLDACGSSLEVKAALMRLVDFLKQKGVTALLTDLKAGGNIERTDGAISPLVDTWLVLRDLETNGERNRGLHILKSRGMSHSNQVCEFVLSDTGIQLTDVCIGPSGMLTGSARMAQEARERAEHVSLGEEAERQQLALECKRTALEGQIATLRAEFSAEEATIARILSQDRQREASLAMDKVAMGRSRQGDAVKANGSRTHQKLTRGKS